MVEAFTRDTDDRITGVVANTASSAAVLNRTLAWTGETLDSIAAVFAALMQARAPLDARTIAGAFRLSARAEPAIARILAALARLGHAYTSDGRAFALRRTA